MEVCFRGCISQAKLIAGTNNPQTSVASHRKGGLCPWCHRALGVGSAPCGPSDLGAFRPWLCHPLGAQRNTLGSLYRAEQRGKRKCVEDYVGGCRGQAWKRQALRGFTFYWPASVTWPHVTVKEDGRCRHPGWSGGGRNGDWQLRPVSASESNTSNLKMWWPLMFRDISWVPPQPLEDFPVRPADGLQPGKLFPLSVEKIMRISGTRKEIMMMELICQVEMIPRQ